MLIRPALKTDAAAIAELVIAASRSVKDADFTEQGWALLEKTNSVDATLNRFSKTNWHAWVAEQNQRLLGYIAMQGYEKIDHLFVLEKYRGQGISSALWNTAKAECDSNKDSNYYWVRSSSYAVPVYQSFGFTESGEPQSSNGIRFQLMELQR